MLTTAQACVSVRERKPLHSIVASLRTLAAIDCACTGAVHYCPEKARLTSRANLHTADAYKRLRLYRVSTYQLWNTIQ
jgi:hypothetical protein